MRINHNLAALNTHKQLTTNSVHPTGKNLEKLIAGFRINRSGYETDGLEISGKMRGQIRGLDQAARNSQDGISLIQTTEGTMNDVSDILTRMRDLTDQSINTYNKEDRQNLQKEVNQLLIGIDDIANNTTFNNAKLLNGTSDTVSLQVGKSQSDIENLPKFDVQTSSLGLTKESATTSAFQNGDTTLTANYSQEIVNQQGNLKYGIDITTQEGAVAAYELINKAINNVSSQRASAGEFQQRLELTVNNLSTNTENLIPSESRIRDVDMAKEMMEFTKNNILSQAAQAMLAQANQQPQGVLQLLR